MDEATYDAAPVEARDPSLPNVVHWVRVLLPDGTYEDGVRWAISTVFDLFFGDLLGPLWLEHATQTERLVNGTWQADVVA